MIHLSLFQLATDKGRLVRSTLRWASVVAFACAFPVTGCDSAPSRCAEGERLEGLECVPDIAVKLNSVGYLPDGAKFATVTGGSKFEVRRTEDDAVAFEGDVPPTAANDDTGEQLAVVDFSGLTEPGNYYLVVPGAGQSPPFSIAADVFAEPLKVSMLGLFGQRCGVAVQFTHNGETYDHGECHLDDASMKYIDNSSDIRDATGGWHDAGDYGKYAVNGGFALGVMLKAWEHFQPALEKLTYDYMPETGGALPDFLDEAKFQMEWMLKMQFPDGSVPHKVTGLNFEGLTVPPSGDTQTRFFAPVSTAGAADLVAVAAQSARIFRPYDPEFADKCLAAAELSYEYLKANPQAIEPPDPGPGNDFRQMQYKTGDKDDRFWALAELWETTGREELLEELEPLFAGFQGVAPNWDWSNVHNLGIFTYILSRHAADPAADPRDPELVADWQAKVLTSADSLAKNASEHAYGRGIGSLYYWGTNGVLVRSVMNLHVASQVTDDAAKIAAYRAASLQQIDHILGRNYYGRSQITGTGHNPPMFPHHRPSAFDRNSWPGLLIGGSNIEGENPDPTAAATSWVDAYGDYRTNEVAINWSTAAIYAFAAFMP